MCADLHMSMLRIPFDKHFLCVGCTVVMSMYCRVLLVSMFDVVRRIY